jgi:hypothetical protein
MKSLIKTIMKVFLALFIVLCVGGIAMAYTFDSEIDPKVFVGWEVTGSVQTSDYGGFIMLKNPDPNAKIKEAVIEILKCNVISYEYSIDGKVYKYKFNSETYNYDLVVPEE